MLKTLSTEVNLVIDEYDGETVKSHDKKIYDEKTLENADRQLIDRKKTIILC